MRQPARVACATCALALLALLWALLALLWAYAGAASPRPPPVRPVVYAHRGAARGLPFAPGSLAALRALARAGICHFDVDIFRTSDGHVVIGHPDDLRARLALARSPEALTLAELAASGRGSTATVGGYVRLAVKLCAARHEGALPALLLEPKGAAAARLGETIEKVLAARPPARFVGLWLDDDASAALVAGRSDASALASFYPIKARHVRPTGRPLAGGDVRRAPGPWRGAGPAVAMLTPAFAEEARRRGQQLITWVVNDDDTVRRAQALRVDAVVSDDALRVRGLLSKED